MVVCSNLSLHMSTCKLPLLVFVDSSRSFTRICYSTDKPCVGNFEDSFFISCYNCKKHFKDTLKCDYSKRKKKSSVSRYHIKFDFLFEGQKATSSNNINICYSPAGRYVLEETVPEVFNTSRGRRQRAVLRTEGTVFPNIDRPRRVKNIFFFQNACQNSSNDLGL